MNIKTKRDLIKDIATRWLEQYGPRSRMGKKVKDTYNKLLLLDLDTATEKDIADIIGNNAWTVLFCDECNNKVETIITLGEEENYDSRTASICPECLEKAVQLVQHAK